MDGGAVAHFLRRAADFSRGSKFFADSDENAYSYSAALLAVHAAIAYADALRIGLGGAVLASEDHRTAADALLRLLPLGDTTGVSRFRKLLASKSEVAYGSRKVHDAQLRLICVDAQRFALWANKIGSAQVSGWRQEND